MSTATTIADRYSSRITGTPGILDRQDPTVWGDAADGPLSRDRVDAFARDGFLFFDGLFSPDEVARFSEELERMASDETIKADERTITEPTSNAVRSIFEVHLGSPLFKELAKDPRITGPMRQLLGSDVYIHQSRVNLKPGFRGKEFYWHSDFETWHCEDGMPAPRAISCSILLTDNTEFNGPLMVVPGSHERFVQTAGETPEDHYKHSLKQQDIGVPDDDSLRKLVAEGGIVAPKGKAGSMIAFECNLMHGSNSNISPDPRSNVFYVFNSVENTLTEPFAAPKPRPSFIAARRFTPVDEL